MIKPPLPAGFKHGRLTVLELQRSESDPKHPKYLCRCDCGNETLIQRANLERTHSCGCIKVEMLKGRAIHGMSSSEEFRVWIGIRDRCMVQANTNFASYGGRGITICDRWRDSFSAFYEDMGARPTPKHSIDRINNDGNYEPSNCRWATNRTQCNNKRNNRRIQWDGRTQNLSAWAKETGLDRSKIAYRLNIGWSVHDALTKP